MNAAPTKPHTSEDVSTEAQLWELNNMSRRLRERLDAMIEEQRVRVEEFTERQHSLSALPAVPELQALQQPQAPVFYPQQPQKPQPPQQQRPQRQPQQTAYTPAAKTARTAPPPLPTTQQPTYSDAPPIPARPLRKPVKPSPKKEESGSFGWVFTIIIFIIVVMLRNCG